MKRILVLLMGVFLAVGMIGCSATPMTQVQADLSAKQFDAQVACYERLKEQDAQISRVISVVPEDQVALVLVLQQVQENNKALMSIATGNEYNPCSTGANAFDVQIAEVTEKNKALSSGVSSGAGAFKWLVGGLTISSVADKIGGTAISAGGNVETNANSKNSAVVGGRDAVGSQSQSSIPSYSDSHDSLSESQNTYNEPDDELGYEF